MIPDRESSKSIFSCILGDIFLFWIALSMLIMSSTKTQPITMNIGISKMETRFRSQNDVSTGVMILV
jgi:hypothetical protein